MAGHSRTWESLLATSSHASFFLSRAWVKSWLAVFGEDLGPEFVLFESEAAIVGACILVSRRQSVRMLPVRRIYLNCSGEDEALYIEYNALIAHPEWEEPVADALAAFLKRRGWDELLLPGMVDQPAIRTLRALGNEEVAESVCRYIDLGGLRRNSATFDSALSSNTRQQIRRSQRLYEEAHGACFVRGAQTTEEALSMLEQLGELHNSAWNDRGKPGAFSLPRFNAFHQTLIRAAFSSGGAQLLQIGAGAETLGVLYNFHYRGRVYFYQSGFRYSSDNRLKPGLLAHYLAVRHYLEHSAVEEYDFLAGDSQYKRSLATGSRTLAWSSVRRKTVLTTLFYGLRSLKHTYAGIVAKGSRRDQPPVPAGE